MLIAERYIIVNSIQTNVDISKCIIGTPFDKTIAEKGPIGHNGGPICINREKGTNGRPKRQTIWPT